MPINIIISAENIHVTVHHHALFLGLAVKWFGTVPHLLLSVYKVKGLWLWYNFKNFQNFKKTLKILQIILSLFALFVVDIFNKVFC